MAVGIDATLDNLGGQGQGAGRGQGKGAGGGRHRKAQAEQQDDEDALSVICLMIILFYLSLCILDPPSTFYMTKYQDSSIAHIASP